MKRRFLMLFALGALVAMGLLWLHDRQLSATRAGLNAAPATPAVATNHLVAASVAAKPTPGFLTGTNRLSFRLSNTPKSLKQLLQDPHAILLQNALIDTRASLGALNIPDNLQAKGDPGAYIVQARGPTSPAFRALLQSVGARIVSYIPNNAYLVQISPAVAGALSASPMVQAVLPYEPYYKLQPTLLALAVADAPLPPATVLTVGLFQGTDPSILYAAGYVPVGVPDQSPFGPIIHVLPPLHQPLSRLAAIAGVQAIELGHLRAVANDLARVTLGISADTVTNANWLNLSGSNVTVELNDSGVDATHPDFSLSGTAESGPSGPSRVTGDLASSLTDTNGHGTHVAGIIAGNGSKSYTVTSNSPPQGSVTNADFRGKAPAASLYVVGGINFDEGIGLPDFYLQQQPALTNALISNNSWTYVDDPDYDLAAASYDAATRDALPLVSGSQPVLFVFAAGNNGEGSPDGSGGNPDTILSPGTAKNVITVGALEQLRGLTNIVTSVVGGQTNSSDIWYDESDSSVQVADYSARGNVGIDTEGTYGRFKPDVVAPGSWVVSTRSTQWDTNTYYNPTNYSTQVYNDETVTTNNLKYYNVIVPPNAVSVTITISPYEYSPTYVTNLFIFVKQSDYPTTSNYDFVTSNNVAAIPPSFGGAIAGIQSIQNSGFDFAVADSTNVAVTYDLTVTIATTNTSDSDAEQVLQGLNETLSPWYRYESGTSMAAPAVSGTLALIQDYFTNTLKMTPSPALLKAMLINGSRSIGSYGYALTNSDNFEGWGLPNIQNSLPLTSSNLTSIQLNSVIGSATAPMFFVDQSPTNALATGDSHTYLVTINTNSPNAPQFYNLQATVVWTDPPGDPSAAVKLVNGLELIITNLDTGDVFVGNDINTDLGVNAPEPTNAPPNIDTINNVENIIIPPLLAGNYSVTVFGRSVNVNAVTEQATNVVQDYALVVSVGEGEAPDAIFKVKDQAIAVNLTSDQDIAFVATTNSALVNQFVGANTPFLGTNQVGLGTNTVWGSTGALTLGMTNQWHFYVVTNNALDGAGLSIDVTNAVFITYDAYELSVPRLGVYEEADPANATRPEADIDLYATTDPGLTNLSPVTLSNCLAAANNSGASVGQGGTEFVYFTNSTHGQVYYIGVKSEDQMASEYDFIPIFTATPLSQIQPNGDQLVNGLLLPAYIPDGSPSKPGTTNVFAVATYPMEIENVTVTNLNQHQNFGDLIGALTFGGTTVVLNNHEGLGNTYNTTVPLVYDDSLDPDPGTRHSDGPGTLTTFRGKTAVGPWILYQTDGSLGFTGQISAFNLLIQPHRNLQEPGIIVAIPPGGWFIDYVSVPPGYTNLTFYATNLPPVINPPLQMYEKFGQEPTLTNYDFEAGLTNTLVPGGSPGNSISIGPPLDIGNYFIGVYNPSTTVATNVFISATLGIDNSIHDEFNYASGGSQFVLPDAVTTSSTIPVTATQLVESVNVGLAIQSPQISDLTFTLVSPTGQRILLMENRGGFSTNGAGGTFVYSNILNSTASGGFAANTNYLAVPITGGPVPITYNFYTVPDEMTVYEGTNPATFYLNSPTFLLDTGLTNNPNGPVTISVNTLPGITNITIIINQFGNPFSDGGGDAWTYTAGAAVTNFEYLTFTDDTNLANVPIKFAVPPFGLTYTNPPDYTLSDFDAATNGLYVGPTNIPDANGGWSVPTNIATSLTVLNTTNGVFQTVTVNQVLTNNFVSVVTDPADAVSDNSGSNLLALAKGTITRSISTVPGNIYNVTFWYRGPGIASWWRGEGNASDSSDPENNANNGTLLGLFNFPAGEVDQAFQFENGGNEFMFADTNAYVQVPPSTSLNVGTAGGFTVEGWINPTNLARPQPLVEWLAAVPTNSAVTNLVIKAGPYLDDATGNYYYLLGATDWVTSEQWAEDLGGHLATISTANLQNWVYDNFASSATHNHNLWIGLTNSALGVFGWASGQTNIAYANWLTGQPDTNCGPANFYAGILGATNAQPGLWLLANDRGVDCTGATNVYYGVAEVPMIQTNGVQFWISATNTPGSTNAPFATAYGSLYANIVDTNFVAHEIHSPPGLLSSNVFQHVALTYDTNSGIARLYLNGTNVATTNFSTAFVPKTDGDVLLGHDLSPAANNYFSGLMDEMSVYRRALSPAEILSIYQVSAFSTNRTVGKFDPSVTPAVGLAEALVSFGGATNLLFGVNNRWELNSYTFTATSNSMPLTISGLEPGILLDDFQVSQAPVTNLYYLPEQDLSALTGDSAYGDWTLQVWDNLNGIALTNLSEILSWQLSFVLQSNATFAASLAAESPTPSTIPAGQTVFYEVNVPSWAHFATNVLVNSTLPVNLFFNPTNTPTGTGPGDQTLLTSSTGGVSPAITVNTNDVPYPLLQAGSTYYLGVQNTNSTPAQIVLQVNYDIPTLTNGAPYSAAFGTNDTVNYYRYIVGANAYAATFQLLKLSSNADLVISQGVPLPTLTNSAYGSFNVSNLDQNIYVLTNSTPVPLSPGTWYLGVIKRDSGPVKYSVLAQELDVTNGVVTNAVNLINLASGVPFNFNAGPGADLTNFYTFTVAASTIPGVTNYGVLFELYNLTGNGDLTVQTNGLPLAPPFFQTSQNRGLNPESILIFTNAGFTNIDLTYYVGVPSHEITNINYTIAAAVLTNGYFPGFPGATGAGGGAVGAGHVGTVSTVYHVYSTNDDGSPGTLRDAVSSTNRTIVFDLSGTINLLSPLVITNSYLTIAGQTAPGDGITVLGNLTTVTNAHDIIIRDLRFRSEGPFDSLQFLAVSNVVADHVSAEWSSNNLVSLLYSANVTVQWSMLAQSLLTTNVFTPTNPANVASLFLGGNGAFSFDHNLYADNNNGSPLLGDDIRLDFVNNVIYDWGTNAGFSPNGSVSNPGAFTNYLNYTCNYLIASSNSGLKTIAFNSGSSNTWIFQTNNFIDSNTNGILDGANTGWNMFTNQFTEFAHAFPLVPVPTDEAYQAYERVLDFAGADMTELQAQRDSVDRGIVTGVRTQTGTLISAAGISPTPNSLPVYLDTDQDGIPDFWEITFGQPPYAPSNNNPSTNAFGYTTLEEYDNWLAGPHAVTPTNTPVGVDLQRLFGGSGRLSFLATNAVHGSVYLTNVLGAFTNTSPFSNSIAVLVPTNTLVPFTGYASFDVYVTNHDTVAYFGPVTVSVVVSAAPVALDSNVPPQIITLAQPSASAASFANTNAGGSDYYVFNVTTNLAGMSPVAVLFTVTNATGPVDLVANYGLPLPTLSDYEFISTNSYLTGENILISSNSTPVSVTNGLWYLAVVNVAGSNVSYTVNATELFSVSPPVFVSPTNTQVFSTVETFPFSYDSVATDPNTPALPLTFSLASGPTNLTVTSGGVINWTPTVQQGPNAGGPSTNAVAISVSNGDFAVTNTFSIIVLGATNTPNVTNSVNVATITRSSVNGTNGLLLTWYAPSNDLFTVQWSGTIVPANWISFTNVVSYNTNYPASATNATFTFFDDGSQDGGLATSHFYRLILLGEQIQTNSLSLPSQPELVVGPQTTFSVTNTAVDSNPSAVVTYSLPTAPAGAVISASGVITWTTPATGTATTNTFITVATDNGSPAASATNTFQVIVTTQPGVGSEQFSTNGLLLTWFAPASELFQVEWRTNLIGGPWTLFTNIISFNPAAFTSASHTQFNFLDNGSQSGPFTIPHYYQLILLPSALNPVQTSPVISGVISSAGGTTLQWIAPSNEIFKVQWTSNLIPPVAWAPFTNIITSGSTNYSFTDTNAALLMRFYELLLLP